VDKGRGLPRSIQAGWRPCWSLLCWPDGSDIESTDPRSIDRYNLGNSYFDLGRPYDALVWYDRAAEHMPDAPYLIINQRWPAPVELQPARTRTEQAEARYRDPALLRTMAERVKPCNRRWPRRSTGSLRRGQKINSSRSCR